MLVLVPAQPRRTLHPLTPSLVTADAALAPPGPHGTGQQTLMLDKGPPFPSHMPAAPLNLFPGSGSCSMQGPVSHSLEAGAFTTPMAASARGRGHPWPKGDGVRDRHCLAPRSRERAHPHSGRIPATPMSVGIRP